MRLLGLGIDATLSHEGARPYARPAPFQRAVSTMSPSRGPDAGGGEPRVEAVARLFDALAVGERPGAERLQRRGHGRAEGREGVLDARWHLGVDAAQEQTVALHRAQRLGEDLLRDR